MKKNTCFFICFVLVNILITSAIAQIKRAAFFEKDELITMDLSTDLKQIVSKKQLNTFQPATVTLHFPDSTVISEEIKLSARGEFRRQNCYIPTMMLDFKNQAAPKLSSLRKLKLVCGCGHGSDFEKLILKEYLVYKMYNMLTDMSFRVRLLKVNYSDTRQKVKSYSQYGFLIEGTDEMAKRNKCREVQKITFLTEKTNRSQMTMVAIFQYMIGNTDWAVPNYHNIKLMRTKKDSTTPPYTIPYDFDFCGLVNANYATPNEELDIKSVQQRLYRGFPRTMAELQNVLDIFREKREAIKQLVLDFELLSVRSRKEIMAYIDEFYKMIESKSSVELTFIDNARRS